MSIKVAPAFLLPVVGLILLSNLILCYVLKLYPASTANWVLALSVGFCFGYTFALRYLVYQIKKNKIQLVRRSIR